MDWFEMLQKLIPWASGLSLMPKLALSALVLSLAALAMALLWAGPTGVENRVGETAVSGRKSEVGPSGPNVDQHGSPGVVAVGTWNSEELRRALGSRSLRPLESEKPLKELPPGVYGYTVPWALTGSDQQSIMQWSQDFSLSDKSGGTVIMEVHKLANNHTYVLGFLSDAELTRVLDPSKIGQDIELTFFLTPYGDNIYAAAIPIFRLKSWRSRDVDGIGTISDIILQR